MRPTTRKKALKIFGGIGAVLLLIACIGFMYLNNIAVGSNEGNLPTGYQLVEANGYQFSTITKGNPQDTPVILLHGFPESSAMWKSLMADLKDIGYYSIAFDQRGYSFGARPEEIEQYKVTHLAKDVIAIADALGVKNFHLIGHDWGSGVGWQVASDYPDRLLSFTSLSVPHLEAFSRAYQEDSLQHKASGYIRSFQTEKLPEFALAKDDYQRLKSLWNVQGKEEITAYTNLYSEKNALTGAINWYRANFSVFEESSEVGMIHVPVLFIWGKNDGALQRSGVEWTADYVKDYYRFVELDAGHCLIQEAYEDVYDEIKLHLEKF